MENHTQLEQKIKDAYQKDLDSFKDVFINEDIQVIKQIYIELPFIQDIYLGAVLLLKCMNDPNNYKYLLECISSYNNRLKTTIAEYFPQFNLTDENISTFIQNPKNSEPLLLISPMTSFFDELTNLTLKWLNISQESLGYTAGNKNISFIINLYPLNIDINSKVINILRSKLNHICKGVPVSFINSSVKLLKSSIIDKSDVLIIHNFEEFFDENSKFFKPMFYQLDYYKKYLFIPWFISDEGTLKHMDMTNSELVEKHKDFTNKVLDSFTKFTIVRTPIINVEDK